MIITRTLTLPLQARLMACPDENAILEFLTKAAPVERRRALEDHIDDCTGCRELLSELARSMFDASHIPAVSAAGVSAAGAIPADLRERLQPARASAEEIRGKWKISYEGGAKLVLTEIVGTDRAGEEVLGRKEARLPIYRTAPDVVRIGEPQYVFGVGP